MFKMIEGEKEDARKIEYRVCREMAKDKNRGNPKVL